MLVAYDDFGRDVLGSPTEGARPSLSAPVYLAGDAEVDDLDVSPLVQHQILQLHVSVHDALAVKILHCTCYHRHHLLTN